MEEKESTKNELHSDESIQVECQSYQLKSCLEENEMLRTQNRELVQQNQFYRKALMFFTTQL